MKLFKALAVLSAAAALFAGCEVQETNTTCTTGVATFNVYNNSTESVQLTINGPELRSEVLADLDSRTYTLTPGSYSVTAVGSISHQTVLQQTRTFTCDGSYSVDLQPVSVTPPSDPELDLFNDTNENLEIYIDDSYENTLLPGQIGNYPLIEGYHSVTVVQESTGEILYDDIDDQTFYANENIYELHITSTAPEIEIHNNLDLTDGASAESLVSWVDYDLGFTTPIVYDSGYSNVLPAEIATFAIVRGDHLIEVMGEDSGFFYVDETNGFMLYPENTTTIFDIQ